MPLPWTPPEPEAHPPGRARLAVADEHVRAAVGVARHQVAGQRDEGDEAPVRRDRRRSKLSPLPWTPPGPTLTRSVVPVWRSRTNTSVLPLVSPGTRLLASESKATNRPSAEIAGVAAAIHCPGRRPARGSPAGSCPSGGRGRTRPSMPLVSPGTRLVASETKATKRPSAEIDGIVAVLIALDAARPQAHAFRDAVRPGRHGRAERDRHSRSKHVNSTDRSRHSFLAAA